MTGTSGSRTGRVRVRIVDDEPTPTRALSAAVTEAGRRPHPAADGHSVLRVARRRAPLAVVLPELDWSQLPSRLRRERPTPPALMLTADEAPEHSLGREIGRGRAPMIHTVGALGHAIVPAGEGR
jgi:two-component system OmpR family response regulator